MWIQAPPLPKRAIRYQRLALILVFVESANRGIENLADGGARVREVDYHLSPAKMPARLAMLHPIAHLNQLVRPRHQRAPLLEAIAVVKIHNLPHRQSEILHFFNCQSKLRLKCPCPKDAPRLGRVFPRASESNSGVFKHRNQSDMIPRLRNPNRHVIDTRNIRRETFSAMWLSDWETVKAAQARIHPTAIVLNQPRPSVSATRDVIRVRYDLNPMLRTVRAYQSRQVIRKRREFDAARQILPKQGDSSCARSGEERYVFRPLVRESLP